MADKDEFLKKVKEQTENDKRDYYLLFEAQKSNKANMAYLKKRIASANDLLVSQGEAEIPFDAKAEE